MDADNLEPRRARIGTGNPECVNNPFWRFRIAHALALKGLIPKGQADAARAAWKTANRNKLISDSVVHPLWSFDRFGQTTTALPDGRIPSLEVSTKIGTIPISLFTTMSWYCTRTGRLKYSAIQNQSFPRQISIPQHWSGAPCS
jgi:hypothetical protein